MGVVHSDRPCLVARTLSQYWLPTSSGQLKELTKSSPELAGCCGASATAPPGGDSSNRLVPAQLMFPDLLTGQTGALPMWGFLDFCLSMENVSLLVTYSIIQTTRTLTFDPCFL